MTTHISAMKVRQNFGDILNRVALRHDHFIVERNGKPLVRMIPAEQWEGIEAALRADLLKALDHPNLMSQAEADQLANDAKHESRVPPKKRKR